MVDNSNKSYKNEVFDILKLDDRIWDRDKEEINKIKLFDLIDDEDEKLIELLFNNEITREHFFNEINNSYVFKQKDFKFFIEENKVYNSFTKYKNKIGLSDKYSYLINRGEVVLDFPYKDCILKGGQSDGEGKVKYYGYDEEITKTEKKEGYEENSYNLKETKREEIFFNRVLAKDEIDRLLDEKAFVNWKRYNKDGENKFDDIKKDENGDIVDNLIIKGNNLLTLHSLKNKYKEQVKLIYIDPPYNTGNDDFKYNDNFNHSTWLTFMKNRLTIAKEFLSKDGLIVVQCDDNEQSYLKVLMDGIFGKNNFVNCIAVKMSNLSGQKMAHINKRFPKLKEYLLIYKRDEVELNEITIEDKEEEWDPEYNIYLENFSESIYKKIIAFDKKKYDVNKLNEELKNVELKSLNEKIEEIDISENKIEDWLKNNSYRIARTETAKNVMKLADKKEIYNLSQDICAFLSTTGILYVAITDYTRNATAPRIQVVFAKESRKKTIGDMWLDISTTGLHTEGKVTLRRGKKPEKLLKRIIYMSTKPGDIVMDFFLGSGTTAAVAHKMNRKYVGIEQLDYGENSAVERLKNVIKGEQTGISQEVDWDGGGDFIYTELAKWNQKAKEKIMACEDYEELKDLFEELYDKYFLNYNVKIKEFKEEIIHEDKFKDLALERQKEMFITMLDQNQLYVNKTEMEDKRYNISKEDRKLNNLFYSK